MLARLRAFRDALLHRRRFESEMEAEMRFHMDAFAADLIRAGIPRAEAERRARMEFGSIGNVKEDCRQSLGLRLVEELRQDLTYAARGLRRSPGFTAAAVASLALAIGANTIIFSFVNGIAIKPYPYRDSSRLVRLFQGTRQVSCTPRELLDLRERHDVFSDLAARAIFTTDATVSGAALPASEHATAVSVTANYFEVLGTQPSLGRGFLPEENQPGRSSVAVLSNRFWRERTGADPHIAGKRLRLNDREYQVVGVLPAGSFDREVPQLWIPFEFTAALLAREEWLTVIARLRPGVSAAGASSALSALGYRVELFQYTWERAPLRRLLLLLWGAVGLLLLMGCANVGNLLLARAAARRQEVAIRLSIGAGRWRLLRQFLTESLLLSVCGGALGLVLALAVTGIAVRLVPRYLMPPEATLNADWRVLLFTLAISIASGILFGFAPGWQFSSTLSRAMARPRNRLRAALLVAETAIAVILAAGAGLVTHSFTRLSAVDPGFRPANLFAWSVRLPSRQYPTAAAIRAYEDAVLERLTRLPGIESAAAANALPMLGTFDGPVQTAGSPATRGGAMYWIVTPDYLTVLRLRMVKGRWLAPSDGPAAPRVAVVNEALARSLFGSGDPLGRAVRLPSSGGASMVIVGVVRPTRLHGIAETGAAGEIYFPVSQAADREVSGLRRFVVRTRRDAGTIFPAVREIAASIDKQQPLFDARTMEETINGVSFETPRFRAALFGGFGLLGLVLAAAGVYGVLRFAVAQRTHEIGVRMALGARGRDVVLLVMRESLLLLAAGLALGMAAAVALTRLLASLLYEIQPRDPATLTVVAAVVALSGLAAAWLPARRAAAVQPVAALRHE